MEQENEPEACSAAQGPFCHFVNDKPLNHQERTDEDDYYHYLKKTILPNMRESMLDAKQNMMERGGFPKLDKYETIIYYPNARYKLDQALYPNHYPAVHTFTFTYESFKPVAGKVKPFTKAIDFKLAPKAFVHKKIQKLKNLNLEVTFEGIYLQKNESILEKRVAIPKTSDKGKFTFLESDSEREKIMFGSLVPDKNYALTLKDTPGLMKLSKPSFFRFVFLKPGNGQTEAEIEGGKTNSSIFQNPNEKNLSEFYIIGRLRGQEVFRKNATLIRGEWKRVYFPYKYQFDELEVSPNTHIDNLEMQFNYTHFEQHLTKSDLIKLVKASQNSMEKLDLKKANKIIDKLVESLGIKDNDISQGKIVITEIGADGKVKITRGKEAEKIINDLIGGGLDEGEIIQSSPNNQGNQEDKEIAEDAAQKYMNEIHSEERNTQRNMNEDKVEKFFEVSLLNFMFFQTGLLTSRAEKISLDEEKELFMNQISLIPKYNNQKLVILLKQAQLLSKLLVPEEKFKLFLRLDEIIKLTQQNEIDKIMTISQSKTFRELIDFSEKIKLQSERGSSKKQSKKKSKSELFKRRLFNSWFLELYSTVSNYYLNILRRLTQKRNKQSMEKSEYKKELTKVMKILMEIETIYKQTNIYDSSVKKYQILMKVLLGISDQPQLNSEFIDQISVILKKKKYQHSFIKALRKPIQEVIDSERLKLKNSNEKVESNNEDKKKERHYSGYKIEKNLDPEKVHIVNDETYPVSVKPKIEYSEPIIEYSEPVDAKKANVNEERNKGKKSKTSKKAKKEKITFNKILDSEDQDLEDIKESINNDESMDEETKKMIKDAFEDEDEDNNKNNQSGGDIDEMSDDEDGDL